MTVYKRVKNNTGSTRVWRGQQIAAGAYFDLNGEELTEWGEDDAIAASVLAGELVMNNNSEDITDVNHGAAFLRRVRRIGFTLTSDALGKAVAVNTFTTLAQYLWIKSRGYNYINGVAIYQTTSLVLNQSLIVRVQDTTNNVTLGTQTTTTNGVYFFTFTNPTTNASIELQARKASVGLGTPTIGAAALEWDLI